MSPSWEALGRSQRRSARDVVQIRSLLSVNEPRTRATRKTSSDGRARSLSRFSAENLLFLIFLGRL